MFLALVNIVTAYNKMSKAEICQRVRTLFPGCLSLILDKPPFKFSGEVYTENEGLDISCSCYRSFDPNLSWHLCLSFLLKTVSIFLNLKAINMGIPTFWFSIIPIMLLCFY